MNIATQTSRSVLAAQALFFLNAAIWLLFGILSIARIVTDNPNQIITAWVIAILMLGNVGAMILAGIGIGKQRRIFFYLALAVLLANILLTFTDQFGVFDFLTLVIDLVLLALLVADRRRYLSSETN